MLHADDTVVLSTNRELFIHKCNVLVDTITQKKMSLNYKKSGFLIINGGPEDVKCNLKLKSGWLIYNAVHKYLGGIFTDTGSVSIDVDLCLKQKTKEVNVKLASFLLKNEYAPISVKLKVANACINSAILYGCESWGSCPLHSIEILQRKALKIVLDISKRTPNEIVYVESGCHTLKPSIYKRQFKFFQKILDDCREYPNSPVSAIYKLALDSNTQFIRHYRKLENMFNTPKECYDHYVQEYEENLRSKIHQKFNADPDSALGTYCRVNPDLKTPTFNKNVACHELDRKIITRYRTGCHMLKIQAGRLSGMGREERLCSCQQGIQTLAHVLFDCPITENIRVVQGLHEATLEQFFNGEDMTRTATVLKAVAKQLSI